MQAEKAKAGAAESVWSAATISDSDKLKALTPGFTKGADGKPDRLNLPGAKAKPEIVKVEFVPGMDHDGFQRKTDDLKALGQADLLYKAVNPLAPRGSATKDYRQDLIHRIHETYGKAEPAFSRAMIAYIAGDKQKGLAPAAQPDHVWELQLGGPDAWNNLRFLHAFTNEHIGTQQIRAQIRSLPPGTPIRIRIK